MSTVAMLIDLLTSLDVFGRWRRNRPSATRCFVRDRNSLTKYEQSMRSFAIQTRPDGTKRHSDTDTVDVVLDAGGDFHFLLFETGLVGLDDGEG